LQQIVLRGLLRKAVLPIRTTISQPLHEVRCKIP
jgi:hypothetical protein